MTANPSIDAPNTASFPLADADHAEVHALDLDDVVQWADFAEELHPRRPTRAARRGGSARPRSALIMRPRSASNVAKSRYSRVTPWIWMFSSTCSRYVTVPRRCACAMTDAIAGLKRRMASASASVMRGLFRVLLFVFRRAHGRKPLDGERIGADVGDDGARDHRVHALNQRDDRHDRRHGDDIAEHGHERPQLVGPDGLQRDGDRFEDLVHDIGGGSARAGPALRTARRLPAAGRLLQPDLRAVGELADGVERAR